jgi:hypothetical protein
MNWYLAKMVFRIICGEGEHTPQFDEQLRLVAAGSKDEAFRKAREMGLQEEETFYNRKEQLVQWQFINISELHRLSELIDGAELYSRIEEKDNAEAYIYTINQKAGNIESRATPQRQPPQTPPKESIHNRPPKPDGLSYQLSQSF